MLNTFTLYPLGVYVNRRLVDCRQEVVAGALAAAAGLGADLTVLHTVLGVLVALVAAEASRVAYAISESKAVCPEKILRVAYIGAIEVESDAANQHLHVLLAEAGVGAGGTGLRAV